MFWPFNINVEKKLAETKKIKVHHMRFKIKKINVLDFCAGARVCAALYNTYQLNKSSVIDETANFQKIKSHYIDVLMAGIVYPVFSRKQGEEGSIFVENLLTDWSLASELYEEIMKYSYGKKKL